MYNRFSQKFSFLKKILLSFTLAVMTLFTYFYLTNEKPELLERFNFFEVKNFLDKSPLKVTPEVNVKSLLNQIATRRPEDSSEATSISETQNINELLGELIDKVDRIESNSKTQGTNDQMNDNLTSSDNLNKGLSLSRFPNSPLYNNPKNNLQVSFLFNCLEGSDNLAKILDILKDWNIKTTFFIDPRYLKNSDKFINQIILNGHEIGLLYKNYFDFNINIIEDKKNIEESLGLENIFLIRLIENTDADFMKIDEFGLRAVEGEIDSEDQKNIESVILKKLENETKGGDIIIFNVDSINSSAVLPNYLKILQKNNLSVVTIKDLYLRF